MEGGLISLAILILFLTIVLPGTMFLAACTLAFRGNKGWFVVLCLVAPLSWLFVFSWFYGHMVPSTPVHLWLVDDQVTHTLRLATWWPYFVCSVTSLAILCAWRSSGRPNAADRR